MLHRMLFFYQIVHAGFMCYLFSVEVLHNCISTNSYS